MAKRKLKKFAEVNSFDNCFFLSFEQAKEDSFQLKGKWHQAYFKNNNPIVLELGCGKGEYSVGLAKRYPDKNFIGVDIKGNRIHTGAKIAVENKMNNVAFIRCAFSLRVLNKQVATQQVRFVSDLLLYPKYPIPKHGIV